MEKSYTMAPVSELKEQARRLRTRLRGAGVQLSHSETLELVARQHGVRDWNTLRALADKASRLPLRVGERVSGTYLGQRFAGVVKAISMLDGGRKRRVTLHFDEPVDVVTFDSFSALRQRVTAVVGPEGRTAARTSNGVPHLVLDQIN